jgi:hypothetical protein
VAIPEISAEAEKLELEPKKNKIRAEGTWSRANPRRTRSDISKRTKQARKQKLGLSFPPQRRKSRTELNSKASN